jgi:hypothetical protein
MMLAGLATLFVSVESLGSRPDSLWVFSAVPVIQAESVRPARL